MILLLALLASELHTIEAGPLTLEIHLSRPAQTFHIVDQISKWSEFCHPQYQRLFRDLSAEDQALLDRHAEVRRRLHYGALDQTLYGDLPWAEALERAVKENKLSAADAAVERALLDRFGPRIAAFLADSEGRMKKAVGDIEARRAELALVAVKAARFGGSGPAKVEAYLVPSNGSGSGGGGVNGGRLVVELVEGQDPFDVLLHESWHALVHVDDRDLTEAQRRAPGLDRTTLEEGLAYALMPGLYFDAGVGSLAAGVRKDLAEHKSLDDALPRFRRFGLAIQPLLEEALDDPEARLSAFVPRMVDLYRAEESLHQALDPEPQPAVFLFGAAKLAPAIERAQTFAGNIWSRPHQPEAYRSVLTHVRYDDILVFSLTPKDLPNGVPAEYRALLPAPWAEIEAALAAKKPRELVGRRKGWTVLAWIAEDQAGLETLARRSERFGPRKPGR